LGGLEGCGVVDNAQEADAGDSRRTRASQVAHRAQVARRTPRYGQAQASLSVRTRVNYTAVAVRRHLPLLAPPSRNAPPPTSRPSPGEPVRARRAVSTDTGGEQEEEGEAAHLVSEEVADVRDAVAARRARGSARALAHRRARVQREQTHRIMVGRSRLRPNPRTRTSAGRPIVSSISGRNMPELPISTHLPRPSCQEKISSDGSV